MFSKKELVFLVVYLCSEFSNGKRDTFLFREDYSYIETTEGFYKIHTIKQAWADAKQTCALEGASLFYPDNRDEANAVISFWKTTQPNIAWAFVGLSDIKYEGVFETIDGKPVSEVYNQWQTGQPKDLNGNRDCVHLNLHGNINDVPCDIQSNFICKKSLLSLEWNYRCNMSNLDGETDKKFYQQNSGYLKTTMGYYKIHTTEQTWANARRVCALEGASLFYPDNKDEANTVISFWKWTQPDIAWAFVGLSDIRSEGVFKTIDGKSVSEVYNQWQTGQPNDLHGNRDCVHLNLQGNINDVPCDSKSKFICKSLPLLEWNRRCNVTNLDEQQQNYRYIEYIEDMYVLAEESFYKFHRTPKNWLNAKQVCELEGAILYYPENSNEAKAILSIWKRLQNNTSPRVTWLFVGISDINTEGVFETVDGKSISEVYKQWVPNQPDNTNNEDCVHLNQEGNINDISCDSKFSFFCKKSFMALQQNKDCNNHESKLDKKKPTKPFRKDYSYIEDVESFYKIHTTPLTWAEAKQICALEGATFWHPDNATEALAVISFWNSTHSHLERIYVGLSDKMAKGLFETTEGKSASDVYANWQPGQPDDNGGKQDCVYMHKNGSLDDWGCDYKYSFICKKTLQSLEWSDRCNIPFADYTFNEDNGKCYKLHTTPLSWNDSYAVCRLEQSNLAVISSRQEADYLVNLTKSTPKPLVKENYQRGIYHVGFHNRFNEGWQTVKGTPMHVDAEAWWNNYQPADDRNQCGSMFYTGRLTNTDCAMKSFFICENELAHSSLDLDHKTKKH